MLKKLISLIDNKYNTDNNADANTPVNTVKW